MSFYSFTPLSVQSVISCLVELAVLLAHHAAFANAGQMCSCGSRTFVHEKIYDQFLEKSVLLAQKRIVGNPFDSSTQQGPQISRTQLEKVLSYVESGKSQGATLSTGGECTNTSGYFMQPTIFSNVKDDMTIAKEEIFGPVMCVLKYNDYDEVIKRANNTDFGLAAGVITKDLTRSLKFIDKLKAGSVWINDYHAMRSNAPFGGYKQSGHGREMGSYGLREYYQVKAVAIKLA
ncbi:unnamed protein product [Didymodactylos carnosus]|uniref:Aldehyde dehydrogenase domain-containing protein n=1 Tax=Didymodactylos carnosus TaxID=1234261 RepID=A0A814IIE3_9BILA|nr:unnamed protein product [Didymodactylos carnosus]CAF1239876.1 unnamed protein product [Didymodactylos carnosus]CAF3794486.1 unnamed protein product [Didymodactylos carnosus]CAF4047472.1 unnamed protein product [Didymodactylos carnosus]